MCMLFSFRSLNKYGCKNRRFGAYSVNIHYFHSLTMQRVIQNAGFSIKNSQGISVSQGYNLFTLEDTRPS